MPGSFLSVHAFTNFTLTILVRDGLCYYGLIRWEIWGQREQVPCPRTHGSKWQSSENNPDGRALEHTWALPCEGRWTWISPWTQQPSSTHGGLLLIKRSDSQPRLEQNHSPCLKRELWTLRKSQPRNVYIFIEHEVILRGRVRPWFHLELFRNCFHLRASSPFKKSYVYK